eukprot:TRINITY_DN49373_c0_g1_i1.p1 TRINITY_DN49373_c0_g1~~TRINITY_DN49373_c0_g1_i1.p1  ORF type:complete len:209 (-),score=21.15 TRINITY_DN49373_c0_g1_i1:15-641(-)
MQVPQPQQRHGALHAQRFRGWTFSTPTKWVLHEKVRSFSGNDFTVKDMQGNVVARADGKLFSFSNTTTLTDSHRQPLCQIRKEHFHLHSQYRIESADGGHTHATMRRKILSWKPDIRVFDGPAKFGSHGVGDTSSPQILQMNGSWTGRNTTFTDPHTGQVLAHSHERYTNVTGWVFGQDEYVLEIAPGVDCMLIFASILCIDNMKENP